MSLVNCSKAEVVECPGQEPCWSTDGRWWLLTVESMRASITFAGEEREVLRVESLPGFGIGMTMDDFHIDGILAQTIYQSSLDYR